MRRTSVRKFIHMVIDILPLLIIPIFALNILHKETEPISIEVQEHVYVDFNQLYQNSFSSYNASGVTVTPNNDGSITLNGTVSIATETRDYPLTMSNYTYILNHIYVWGASTDQTGLQAYIINRGQWSGAMPFQIAPAVGNVTNGSFNLRVYNGTVFDNTTIYPQLFDLTQMYGEGNEPTLAQFRTDFPLSAYPYTLSKKMLINKSTPTTFNSTDIGSQFIYALYKPVNDYFNFNNLFNMSAIYNWIELNLFSGTAPLPIFIIWNVIVYEFFVDLIFLLYGVFMFIIDFAEKCLEKPFRR